MNVNILLLHSIYELRFHCTFPFLFTSLFSLGCWMRYRPTPVFHCHRRQSVFAHSPTILKSLPPPRPPLLPETHLHSIFACIKSIISIFFWPVYSSCSSIYRLPLAQRPKKKKTRKCREKNFHIQSSEKLEQGSDSESQHGKWMLFAQWSGREAVNGPGEMEGTEREKKSHYDDNKWHRDLIFSLTGNDKFISHLQRGKKHENS